MGEFSIAYLPGDGVGPEVVGQARRVLEAVGEKFGHRLVGQTALVGACSIERHGREITDEVIDLCKSSHAVLLGACGVAGGAAVNGRHPERAVLDLREGMGLWSNIRPLRLSKHLLGSSPVKREIIEGADLLVFRELTGGIYFAEPKGRGEVDGEPAAFDTLLYRENEVRRIVTRAFEHAEKRRGLVTSVDKINVLESSRFWREIAEEVAAGRPDVKFESMLVDAFAMRLILSPRDFDVVVTGNMFGDILTDEMSVLAGSLGLMPSASLGDGGVGLYEPIHGSAPDIAGDDVANPLGTILSGAMLLELSLGLSEEARAVEDAVEAALAKGYRTADIMGDETSLRVGTAGMGDAVIAELIS